LDQTQPHKTSLWGYDCLLLINTLSDHLLSDVELVTYFSSYKTSGNVFFLSVKLMFKSQRKWMPLLLLSAYGNVMNGTWLVFINLVLYADHVCQRKKVYYYYSIILILNVIKYELLFYSMLLFMLIHWNTTGLTNKKYSFETSTHARKHFFVM
jgi:hypothetical protein